MNRYGAARVWLLLGLLLWGGWGAAWAGQSGQPPVLLCFGDDLTAGYGVGLTTNYPAQLQAQLKARGYPHRVVNLGRSGDASAQALGRLTEALNQRPAVTIVALGLHDILRGGSMVDLKLNLTRIVTALQKGNSQVLLAGVAIPPRMGGRLGNIVAPAYLEVASKTRVPLLPDLLAGVLDQPSLVQLNAIHPTGAGYRKVVETLWPHLEPLLAAPPR